MNYFEFDYWKEAHEDGIIFEISIKINDNNQWLQLTENLKNHTEILNFYESKNEEMDISNFNFITFSIFETNFNGLIEDKNSLVLNFNPPLQQNLLIKIVDLFKQIGELLKVQIEISYENSTIKDRLTDSEFPN